MMPLPRPAVSTREAYLACISRVRDATAKEAYEGATEAIETAALTFEQHATTRKLHLLKPSDFQPEKEGLGVSLKITSEDLTVKLYERRMVPIGSPGRWVYDQIRLAAPNDVCPLCGIRKVSTLDHYLPRAQFAALSVTPLNLVPACFDCNRYKHDGAPQREEEQTLSPYFEDVSGVQWLRGEVEEGKPATVLFSVGEPPEWPRTLIERVKYHFQVFKLGELYSHHATSDISSIRRLLRQLAKMQGADGVRNYLNSCAASAREQNLNSWKGAMYEALATNEWYCSGGFDAQAL